MFKPRSLRTLLVVGLTMWPASLYAQTPINANLQAFMYQFFLEQVVLARTPGGVGVVAHDPVFANDPTVTNVTDLIRQVSQQISSQVSTHSTAMLNDPAWGPRRAQCRANSSVRIAWSPLPRRRRHSI